MEAAARLLEFIPLAPELAVQGSALKSEARARPSGKDFSLIDGVVLASARSRGLRLLTFDSEFEGFPDVTVLRRTP